MKDLLQVILENLVENKDQISINEVSGEKTVTYEVKVADSDMGKVIGKDGKIAKSIRTVMKAIAAKENKKVTVEFID